MKQYEAQFDSFGTQAPSMGQPIQADLGIDAVANEFDRQNKGAERVQRQVEENQRRLLDAAEIDGTNANTRIDDLKKLASFSQFAASKVIDYQKSINEKKEITGLMEYYQYGVPKEMAEEFDKNESELNKSQLATDRISGKYLREGGLPEVGAALRGMNNHYAVGFAKGMLQDAAANYPAYLTAKRNSFTMLIGGKKVSLANASAAERPVILRALNEMYISQFQGINPAMLNKYLFEGMRKAEAADLIQWQDDFVKKEEAEQTATRRMTLARGLNGGNPAETLNQVLLGEQEFLGSGPLAREKIIKDLKYLRDGGVIGPDRLSTLLTTKFKGKDGQWRRLVDWPEFAAFNEETVDASYSNRQEALERENLRKREVEALWEQQLPELQQQNLRGLNRFQFAKEWAAQQKIDYNDSQFLQNWVNRNPEAVETRRQELLGMIAKGYPIYEENLGGYTELRNDQAISEALAKTGSVTAGDFASADKILTSNVVSISKADNAEGLQADPEATELLENAKKEVRKQYAQLLGNYKDPEKAMAAAIKNVQAMIDPFNGKVNENGKQLTISQSPLAPANYLKLDPKETEFVNIGKAQAAVTSRVKANTDPFASVLPGSESYLLEMEKNVQAGKKDPIPAFYEVLARGQPYSKWHIANAQRIANGQDPLPMPPDLETAMELPPSARNLLERTPIIQDRTLRRVAYQTELAGEQAPYGELLGLIRSGEGSYNSANRGVAGDTPGGVAGLENKTLGEWQAMAYTRGGQYNALGAYQFIPATLDMAAARLGLSADTVMTPAVQDRLAVELIMGGQKRPRLTAFLSGRTQDIEGALDALALEWASVADRSGGTAYPGQGGNAAHISRDSARSVLLRLRDYIQRSPYNQNENLKPGLRR